MHTKISKSQTYKKLNREFYVESKEDRIGLISFLFDDKTIQIQN